MPNQSIQILITCSNLPNHAKKQSRQNYLCFADDINDVKQNTLHCCNKIICQRPLCETLQGRVSVF